jgi:hypothetical protein
MVDRKAVDPDKEIEWTAELKTGGFDRDPVELSERTGMMLTKTVPPTIPVRQQNEDEILFNRATDELGVPPAWLLPVRAMLNEIIKKAEDGSLSDSDLNSYVQEAAKKVPELFGKMDVVAFAKFLEGIAGGAALEGVKDALRH